MAIGPYAIIATFCEDHNFERGVTIYSAFTGIGQDKAREDDPGRMAPIKRDLTMAIVLTGGTVRGTGHVAIAVRYPGGPRLHLPVQAVTFEDAYSMIAIPADIEFSTEVDGMHYFDVLYERRLLVTVPLRVTFHPPFRSG